MVYLPDDHDIERQRRAKRLGVIQLAILAVGLPALLWFFRPTALSLVLSLALLGIGAWNGFAEARSGRLDSSVPPSPQTGPTATRRFFPGLLMLGVVFGSLFAGQFVGAIAALLFFFAGVAGGIALSNIASR